MAISSSAEAANFIYLYSPAGQLISTLQGTVPADQIGSGGITVLSSGDCEVNSPNWDNVAHIRWPHAADHDEPGQRGAKEGDLSDARQASPTTLLFGKLHGADRSRPVIILMPTTTPVAWGAASAAPGGGAHRGALDRAGHNQRAQLVGQGLVARHADGCIGKARAQLR